MNETHTRVPAIPILATLLFLFTAGCRTLDEPAAPDTRAAAPPAQPETLLSDAERELHTASFDHMWETIRDKHWDPKLGGLDWEAVRAELRPRVEAARTAKEARGVMTELLSRLGASHFNVWPATAYDDLRPAEAGQSPAEEAAPNATGAADASARAPRTGRRLGGDGSSGLDLRVLGDEAIITRVARGSTAEAAGIRPGWKIIAIDGVDLGPTLVALAAEAGAESSRDAARTGSVLARLGGSAGETVKVTFEDGAGETRRTSFPLVPRAGFRTEFGNMPAMYLELESKRIAGNVGYIRFSSFMDPERLADFVERSVLEFMDTRGIIIDLRGNPGGIGGMVMGIASWFITEKEKDLGTLTLRDMAVKFPVFPRVEPYGGRVALLIDGCSGSTAEILAQGMKDLGCARLFGSRTAGAALPSVFERLPNGDGFQYAIADFVSTSGVRIEGRGVEPDTAVPLTRDDLLRGRDPALEAAIVWIQTEGAALR